MLKFARLDDPTGADPGFFLGGGAPLRNGVINTNKPNVFAKYQLY